MERDTPKEAAALILRKYGAFFKHQEYEISDFCKKSSIVFQKNPKLFFPIDLSILPEENISVLDIIESDNRIFNKIIAVFAVLCEEIKSLQTEAAEKHYVFLAFYGEFLKKDNLCPEEIISGQIKKLHYLTNFVKRCDDVIKNLCDQLVALYTSNLISLKGAKLDYIFSNLGNLLVVLITIDTLVNASPLRNHWSLYRRSFQELYQNGSTLNQSRECLKSLNSVLNNIEEKILSDKVFQNCIDSLSNIKTMINKSNFTVSDDFLSFLKRCIFDLEKTTIDYYESTYSLNWVKVNALFVFHFLVFANADKKLFKSLLEVNLKGHTVPLFGLAVWHPEQFLLRHASVLCTTNKLSQILAKTRLSYISNKKQSLLKDAYIAQLQSTRWTLEVIKVFSMKDSNLSALNMNHRMELLIQGVKFISQINFIVTTFMSIHMSQSMPITKSSLMAVCKLIEILKGIQIVFKNNFTSISSSVNLITQHLLYQIISQLSLTKKKLMSDKNYTARLDELTAVVIAERALKGPATLKRRIVANISLSFIPFSLFPDDGYAKIMSLLEKLEIIINIHSRVKYLCDCLFVYWHKSVIPIYLENIFASKKDMTRINFIINALTDCSETISTFDKNVSNNNSKIFNEEVDEYFNNNILKPLGQQIETNLRLHAHSHLQLDSINPFIVPVEDNFPLINMKNYRYNNFYISINTAVEHYLSYMFYNLTTVVLHDWKTYGEMRQLAKFKFNLNTVEDNLPTQTLEQGLDVLEIMRNIHVFVSNYSYNLNNQVFIEQSSNNKYLNTINIRHIANSIRTHGIGIMNTTVNFTYQFLRKKFHAFSQFMYDEQIKSRLIKDMRHFREASSQLEQMYSYKRAEKFNKGIRNLGLNDNSQSHLDLFRVLISHIGNAMGYVRMVRSGGLHCCANATMFLPSLDEETYNILSVDDDIDSSVKESLENLDRTIKNLTSNFSQGTDYFKLLVNVFTPVFRSTDNVHLKSFFMIVPPLTLNFVENMLLCKDKMSKKNKVGAAFTDDGFAMGLAYILRLLDQDEGMDSLNWFQSVNKHIRDERKSISEQLANGPTDHLQHALALTEKKLNLLEQEFQLLYFSFSSARIFFQQ